MSQREQIPYTNADATQAIAALGVPVLTEDDAEIATADIADDAVTTAKLAASSVTASKLGANEVRATALHHFKSTEQTGTGTEQSIAHGLGAAPGLVVVIPTEVTTAIDIAEGTHDATNVKVTATSGGKYVVLAVR